MGISVRLIKTVGKDVWNWSGGVIPMDFSNAIAKSGCPVAEHARAALARVTKLHRPVVLHKGAGADHYVTVTVCSTCGGSDAWFDETSQAVGAAAYPCPTVRAALVVADTPQAKAHQDEKADS